MSLIKEATKEAILNTINSIEDREKIAEEILSYLEIEIEETYNKLAAKPDEGMLKWMKPEFILPTQLENSLLSKPVLLYHYKDDSMSVAPYNFELNRFLITKHVDRWTYPPKPNIHDSRTRLKNKDLYPDQPN